jgi:hypothetical protein
MQDVRTAFWRMAGTQQLEGEIDKILGSARQALKDAQGIESERLAAPLAILQYQKICWKSFANWRNSRKRSVLPKPNWLLCWAYRPARNFS